MAEQRTEAQGSTRPAVDAPSPSTSPRHRRIAMASYAALLLLWTLLVGMPSDPTGIALWAWFATYCWHVDAPLRSHLRFVRDWAPVVVLLLVYGVLRGIADQTGVRVHFDYPIRFDEWVGRGEVPTLRLQHALCGDPCDRYGPLRWWDVAAATVYASHFVASLSIAAVLWLRSREEWLRWVRRVLTLWYAGLVGYFLVPTAPPWLASRRGLLDPLPEISSRGWGDIGLHRTAIVGSGFPNQVAAMPSLHTGFSCLIAFYAVQRLRTPWRFVALLYPLAMATTLVYGGDHYVADALGGALTAGAVLVGWQLWDRHAARARTRLRSTAPASAPDGRAR